MEFRKLKGLWKNGGTKPETPIFHENCTLPSHAERTNSNTNNSNNNRSMQDKASTNRLESLEEIRPEVTAEGYGLRTPYGTHLNLDFVKYCEELMSGQSFKRTSSFRRPRSRTASQASGQQQQHYNTRLAGGPSNESLDSLASEGACEGNKQGVRADKTLMETRRRLEAFRSFRSKRTKASGEAPGIPPHNYAARNGVTSQTLHNMRRGSGSPASSSGSLTPNTIASGNGQITSHHLQVVREQMATALSRLRDLEEQVKTIPVLQVKISVLQQEKKHLLDELKEAENKVEQLKSPLDDLDHNKLSPRKSLLSTSSGFSSSSSQSSISSPRSPPPTSPGLPRSSVVETKLDLRGPPLPPKRKYRSIAVGDSTPYQDIVCYSKSNLITHNVESDCQILRQSSPPETVDFSGLVEPCLIDAEFGVFPPPPKEYKDCGSETNSIETINSYSQTKNELNTSATQTISPLTRTIGTGEHAFNAMVDKSCGGSAVEKRDIGVEASVLQNTKLTSTGGLILTKDFASGNHVESSTVGTSTPRVTRSDIATSCEGLLKTVDIGVSAGAELTDQCIGTQPTSTSDVAVSCELPILPTVEVRTLATNTDAGNGRWCVYDNMKDVACGNEQVCIPNASVAVGTELQTCDQCTNTHVATCTTSTIADIRKPSTDALQQTADVVTYESSTDCDDIIPIVTSSTTNTHCVTTQNVSTQYLTDKVDEATSTDDLVKQKHSTQIDDYVDKVQSLLEEQQSLLAENYEGFDDVINKEEKTEEKKVSRFINPAFAQKDNLVVEEKLKEQTSAAISASFHYMQSTPETDESSEEEDNEEDDYIPLHEPSIVDPADLKSILKTPDTPVGEKKFLRFAEGVKSDDSSSEEDYSSSDEEEEQSTSADETKEELKELMREIEEENDVKVKEEDTKNMVCDVGKDVVDQHKEDSKKEEISLVAAMAKTVETSVIEERIVGDGAEDEVFQEENKKYQFTSEVLDACDILEMHMRVPKSVDHSQLENATSTVQQEWFRVAAQPNSNVKTLDDFVTDLADTSLPVLRKVVNMTDNSGNTVLHYAISHNNMRIVETLLRIEELDVNKLNHAGYTAAMLGSLCQVESDADMKIFKQLFEKSNINTHAKEAGQTALMLAVSHGRYKTTKLLIDCGAEVNARDNDGSTPLMCAVEHGQIEIVKLLLNHPMCDAAAKDSDGSTAMNIAMDAGHREIAILLYAQLNFKPNSRSRPRVDGAKQKSSPVHRKTKS
ncbi:uncharacterized protein LOC100176140 isoform X1 [Ciona intestinalis]